MYLHLTAINSGYIFPDFKCKKDQYEYTQFNSTIKALIKDHLGKIDKISTHILRNTGYLFARFGGGVFDVIQRAA
jgi:integrase